jgi:hypothetical protein
MTTAAATREWLDGPKPYVLHNGETLWEKPSEAGADAKMLQGAVIGKRSDNVVCMSVYELPKERTATVIQVATERARAALETMLDCPCTPGNDCPRHSGPSGTPKAIKEGDMMPAA